MTSEAARIINYSIGITFMIYFLLLLNGKIPVKKRSDYLEKNKRLFTVLAAICIVAWIALICKVLFT